VITSGNGMVHRPDLIDARKFSELYSKGNTTVKLTKLPTATSEAEERSFWGWLIGDDNYYETEIVYRYSVTVDVGEDLQRVSAWIDEDPNSRGVIMEPLSEDIKVQGTADGVIRNFSKAATDNIFETDPKAGAAGLNEELGSPINIVVLNPKYFNIEDEERFQVPGVSATATEILVHEAGHNAAHANRHGNHYEYNETGLQSNRHRDIYPTKQNTMKIVNDQTNRRTINP